MKPGGADYTVCEAMLDLELYEARAGPNSPGAVKLLIDLQTAFEKLQLVGIWNWSLYHQFPVLWLRNVARVLHASQL